MIILDTNVVSEPLKAGRSAAVTAWLDRQQFGALYLTAMTLAELLLGLAILPDGQRRTILQAKIVAAISLFSESHILPFDAEAARKYAVLVAGARKEGHAVSISDGQIAAIALSKGFAVATRDAGPFIAAGVNVINPWNAPL